MSERDTDLSAASPAIPNGSAVPHASAAGGLQPELPHGWEQRSDD